MENIRGVERKLWKAADLLRAESKLTANQYCMPVLGLIFLRYMNISCLPEEARYDYLLRFSEGISADNRSLGAAINHAMHLIETQDEQLIDVLPKNYTDFTDDLLTELLTIFDDPAFDKSDEDMIGRVYEFFITKFAKNIATDDGIFFTPKSLVKMIVNVIEPKNGILLDPACGSGGMFIASSAFAGRNALRFYGQEKVEYNAQLCRMNLAVHGLVGSIRSGENANSFYHDTFELDGKCDYVMANPPFHVNKVKAEAAEQAGRLPFGLPGINKNKDVINAGYLWISYFYSYLNEKGRAGFVMSASAAGNHKEVAIRKRLIQTGCVDVMIGVGKYFFYTKSLPCTLWFLNKAKSDSIKDSVLFIDARNYYTAVDRTLNKWTDWQIKNLNAIVWLYHGETEKYTALLTEYRTYLGCEKPFYEQEQELSQKVIALQTESARAIQTARLRERKQIRAEYDARLEGLTAKLTAAKEACWLYEKFGDGVYTDVLGLCRAANISEIETRGWSLAPSTYVGAVPIEDDGVDFETRMTEIHGELLSLQAESNDLMHIISQNLKEMGL